MDFAPMNMRMAVPHANDVGEIQHNLNQQAALQQDFKAEQHKKLIERQQNQVRTKDEAEGEAQHHQHSLPPAAAYVGGRHLPDPVPGGPALCRRLFHAVSLLPAQRLHRGHLPGNPSGPPAADPHSEEGKDGRPDPHKRIWPYEHCLICGHAGHDQGQERVSQKPAKDQPCRDAKESQQKSLPLHHVPQLSGGSADGLELSVQPDIL